MNWSHVRKCSARASGSTLLLSLDDAAGYVVARLRQRRATRRRDAAGRRVRGAPVSRSGGDRANPLLPDLESRGADVVQDAARTVGLAGFAHAAAVEDEQVREERPLLLGYHLQEVALYLLGVLMLGQPEAARDTPDVRVYDDAHVYREGVAQDHVSGLAAHAGEPHQFLHRARNLSSVLLDEGSGHVLYRAGFVSEEANGPYLLLQKKRVRLRVVLRDAVFIEEHSGDLVDPDVGALGRENRGDQELEGILPTKLGPRIGVLLFAAPYYLAYRGGGTFGVVSRRAHGNLEGL